ncbi:MAG: aspartate aminotransferase family protein, partial [Candidatus Bathyarchaeota archaeon]|nr:aspartate aminotransferase family protein [Candidatus Bathyarchaeota archaeon]
GRVSNELNKRGAYIRQQLSDIFEKNGVDVQVTGVSSLFHTHFTKERVKNVDDVFGANREKLLDYHMHLITRGVFFLPTKPGALSTAHANEDIDTFLTEAEGYAKGS